jgi:hypothetical protein
MMKIFQSLSKKNRRSRALKKEKKLLDRFRAAQAQTTYQERVIHSSSPGVGNSVAHEIIVSLTSYGSRIHSVYLTIESLMEQSLPADKIVLCLSNDEFCDETLPATLKRQMKRGLEILYCEKDLGPYTKFFYTLQKYPDSLLITVDDDIIYPIDTIDQLYLAYIKEPDVIHCHRGHKITFSKTGELLPYKQWCWNCNEPTASLLLFPTGVGGVLYFPGCFAPEILNQEVLLRLAPNADDVWLKAMSLKNGTSCKQLSNTKSFAARSQMIEGTQEVSLKRRNKSRKSGNDIQIQAVFEHYDLINKLVQ